jgi:hypothetical protein
VIDYRVPIKFFTLLAQFDGSVVAERTAGELSARCHDEEANNLALNLAHDIVVGQKRCRRHESITPRSSPTTGARSRHRTWKGCDLRPRTTPRIPISACSPIMILRKPPLRQACRIVANGRSESWPIA